MSSELTQSILLLGADKYFLSSCVSLGVDVTVVYGASAKDFGLMVIPGEARAVFVEDQQNVESILVGLHREGLAEKKFDAVYTSDEGAVVAASALGAFYGARSISLDTALRFRNKSLQKDVVRSAGVPVARYETIPDIGELTSDFALPFDKAVLKPIAGAATSTTYQVSSSAELFQLSRRIRANRRAPRTFLLEEFIEGAEWNVDGVVWEGEIVFMSTGQYQDPLLTALTEKKTLQTSMFDPIEDKWVYDRSEPLARRALKALGLRSGVFHMELFYDAAEDSLTFGECAARRGGALIEEVVNQKFGVSLAGSAVHCSLGHTPGVSVELSAGVVGSSFLPTIPGILISCPTAKEIYELPGVEFARIEVPIGFHMSPEFSNSLAKVGQVMVQADSALDLRKRLNEIVEWFLERTVVAPEGASPAQLREWQESIFRAPIDSKSQE
ncbi:acetyl-CoA carboxylase biotin carboxylase subunit family protein [Streptomyces virginiae]|uniref:ATP-grasp domain-containing protein n=1 Tax=Streptomyces virginiae TaxID=1961 RepID=UPI003648D5E0